MKYSKTKTTIKLIILFMTILSILIWTQLSHAQQIDHLALRGIGKGKLLYQDNTRTYYLVKYHDYAYIVALLVLHQRQTAG